MRNLRNSKLLVFIAVIAVFSLMTCVFTACNEDGAQQTTAFNVVFDLNDGSGETVTQEVNPHEITYTPPTREGYDFLHWTMDKDGKTPLSVNDIKNGTTLYAQWKIKTYTVKFYDEDLNLISSVTVNHGESATPPTQEQINEHLKAGRVFVGWNQSLENITRNLAVEMITDSNVSKYTVVFMDGDKEIAKFENGTAGSLIPKPDNPQKKDGFHFDGWKTKDGKTYSEESIFSADETYYSVWTLQDPSTPQIVGDDSVVYGNSANMSIQQNSIQEFEGINYVYEWLDKDGKVVASGNTYQTGALATGEYSYKIKVTASCEGYESKSAVSSAKSLTVEKATLTATLTGATLVYGDDIPTTLPVTFTGFVNGDDESVVNSDNVSYETTYYAGKDIGKYTVTAKGFQAQNYDFTVQSALLTVEQKQISVEKTFEKVYDGEFATAELKEAEGLLEGHVITITFTTKNANVGNYSTNNANEITIDKKVLNAEKVDVTGNYAISATASASILPADIKYELPKVTTFDFDNKSHSAQLSVATPNCRVEYSKDNVNFSQNAPQYAKAGSYKVYVKLSCANYNPVETSFDLTINKAHIAFKATTQNTTYGQNFVLDDKAYIIEDGETFGVNFEVKLSTEYTVGNNVGNYTIHITATETDADNFEIIAKAGYIEVAPATVNIALKDVDVTYGDDLTLSDDLATIDGDVYGNDDIKLALTTTYNKATASVNKPESIIATIGNTNYALGEVTSGVVTVKKYDVTLIVNSTTVVYGEIFDLATLTTNKDSITLANGDVFSNNIKFSYVDNAYTQGANADSTFAVTATATILNGEEDRTANYNIKVTNGTLTVLQREVSIKVNDVDVVYGEAIAQEQYGYTVTSGSFFKEENIKPTYSPTYAEGNFGDGYIIKATINDANHKINITAGAVNITKRKATTTDSKEFVQTKLGVKPTIDLSALEFANRYTGDSFSGVLQTVSADNGTYTYGENGLEWLTELKVVNVKGEDVTAMYDVSFNVTVSIFESAIAHTSTPQSTTYNGKEQTLNGLKVTETGLKNPVIKYSTSLEDGYTLETVPTFKDAGDYTVYYLITADDKTPTEGTYTITIAKKEVTISADDKSVVYGEPTPKFTYTQNGIVEGDTINVTLECAYTQGNNVGSYDIVVNYKESANYAVTVNNATLTVTQKVVNITLENVEVTYGGDLTLSNNLATIDDDVYGNDDIKLALTTTYNKATASVNKPEKITATIGNTNYALGEVTGGVVTVNPFDITLTVNSTTVDYGEIFDLATLTTNKDSITLANGDVFSNNIKFSYVDNAYTQGANADSTFAVTATATILNGEEDRTANYKITVINGTLTVEKRKVSATTNSFSVVYGNNVDTTQIDYTVTEGTFYGTPTITKYAFEDYAPGMFGEFNIDIEFDETTCANHDVTLASGKLTVTPREITVHHTANVAKTDKPYTFTIASIDNAFDGDIISITLTTASADEGKYTANGELGSQFKLDSATFKKADGTDISAAYTVKYDLAIDISENIITAEANGVNTTYNGTSYSGSIKVTDEAVTNYEIKYAIGEKPSTYDGYTLDVVPSFKDAGTYNVYFLITAEGKTPTEGSYIVDIAKAKITFTALPQTAVYSDEFTLNQDAYDCTDDKYGAEFDVELSTNYEVGNDIGTYDITLTATEKATSNFDITPVASTLTVNAKEVMVTASDVTATYGTLASMPEFTVDVAGAEKFVKLSANDYTAKSNVGKYAITATSSNKNYTVNLASAYKVVVEKRAITLTADDKTMTYGESNPELTYTPTNLVEGDKLSGISLAITKDGNVMSGTLNAGEYVITLTADANANANYAITTNTGKLTVDKRNVTVKANNVTVKYGNEIAQEQYGYTVTSGSFFKEENIKPNYETTYSAGKFGNGYTVNVKFDEATIANHNVICESGNVEILKRDVTVQGSNEFVQNEGVFHKIDLSTLTLTGVYGEDKLSGVLTLKSDKENEFRATTLDKFNVTQPIAITNANGEDVTAMYNLAYDISVEVVVKNVNVDKTEKKATYNGTDQNQNLTLPENLKDKEVEVKYSVEEVQNEATVAEGIQYTLDTVLLTKAGTYTVYFRIEVKDGSYTTTFGFYIVKIDKRQATITADNQEKVYGEQIDSTAFTTEGIIDSDLKDFNIHVTTTATNPSVGTHENVLVIEYTPNDNYEVVKVSGKLTVTQRKLTVTAESVEVTYGDGASTLTPISVTGWAYGENKTVTLSSNYVAGSPVGKYPITPKISDENYTVALADNYFVNVIPRTVTVTATSPTLTYGDEFKPEYTVDNVYNGYEVQGVTLALKNSANADVTDLSRLGAGNYTIVVTVADDNTNYHFETKNGSLVINKAPLTANITFEGIENNTIIYGDAMPTATITYTGYKYGENDTDVIEGTAKIVCEYIDTPHAGKFTVGITGVSAVNYDIKAGDTTLFVNKATLTVTPNDAEVTFGDEMPTITWNIDGFKYQDAEKVEEFKNAIKYTFKDSDENEYVDSVNNHNHPNAGEVFTLKVDVSKTIFDNYTIKSTNQDGYSVAVTKREVSITEISGLAQVDYGTAIEDINLNNMGLTVVLDYSTGSLDSVVFELVDGKYTSTTDANEKPIAGAIRIKGYTSKNFIVKNIDVFADLKVNPIQITGISGNTIQEFEYDGSAKTFTFDNSTLFAYVGNESNKVDGTFSTFSVQDAGTFAKELTFTPNSNNYGTATIKVYIKNKSVVDDNGTKYTIEDAFDQVSSGTIKLTTSTSFADEFNGGCYKDIPPKYDYYTLKSGVTLLLPFSSTDTQGWISAGEDGGSDGNFAAHPASNGKETLYIKLTVPTSANLTINGNITVGAMTGSKAAGTNQNAISGNYSQIELNGKMSVNSSTLRVMGYITGGGEIISNGATIIENLVLTGWPGGSAGVGRFVGAKSAISLINVSKIDNPKVFPFSDYKLRSIQVKTTFNYGSSLKGFVKIATSEMNALFITIKAQINEAMLTFITSSTTASDGLLHLTNNTAKIIRTFNNSRTQYNLYGNITDGYSSLNLSVLGNNVSLSTDKIVFPINGIGGLTLKSGCTFNQSYSYKLMPGATFNVESGATYNLNSGAKTVVYSGDWKDPQTVGYSYPTGRGDAVLSVNGTMNVYGSLGGNISGTGSVYFDSNCTITDVQSMEGNGNRSSMNFTFTESPWTGNATLSGYTGTITKGNTYTYKDGSWS